MADPLISFVASVAILLIVARKDLSLALVSGALFLGLMTLTPDVAAKTIAGALVTPEYLYLSFAMALFPVLGALLQHAGGLDTLVESIHIGKKAFMAGAAALIGMLPVPGGALLSAPLVKKAAEGVDNETSFAINIWFRHVLILIYPLSPALIVPASIASISVYKAIPYLFPFFLLMCALGYVFLLRGIGGDSSKKGIDIKRLRAPLGILLMAPAIDGLGSHLVRSVPSEAITLVAVSASVVAAIAWSKIGKGDLWKASWGAKPYRFFFIIMSMYVFIDVFAASGVGERIGGLSLPTFVHCVVIGFALALATGRTQLSASVVIPTYVATSGQMAPHLFALTFVSIFLGYVLSPLHPCISVSLEYFKTPLDRALARLAPMTLIALGITAAAYLVLI